MPDITERTACCACGDLELTVTGDPLRVYACACLECQRATGSAFAYRAQFPAVAVKIAGEPRAFRRGSDAGRWVEQHFCPRCGTLVFMTGEGIPDKVVISVGCFADPGFAPPVKIFWEERRHRWYGLV